MGLTRFEFWNRLGLIEVVEPLVDEAYAREEYDTWRYDLDSAPHGQPWHTSFHASEFPGSDPLACERKALYTLMNVPDSGPVDRRGRGFMDSGKNVEYQLVKRFGRMGWLLSAEVDDEFQTNFVDSHTWLSGSPDIIIIPKGWDRGHVVEVKGKAVRRPPRYKQLIDPIAQMRAMEEGPTPKHVKQLKCYIGMANQEFHKRVPYVWVCQDSWAVLGTDPENEPSCKVHRGCALLLELQPVVDGTLYYVALDDQTVTHSYLYSIDKADFEEGRAVLNRWKEDFQRGELPPRPDGWMWSKDPYPCRFCPLKRDVCKPDDKKGIGTLRESHLTGAAKEVRPDYDYDKTRRAVLSRWGAEDREAT